MQKPTLVIGASTNPERYSYKAITQLLKHNYQVFALANKAGYINDVVFTTQQEAFKNIHTITLYIGKAHQAAYYNYILSLKPKRVIFNPGTENDELVQLLQQNNISSLEACTLVMLSIGTY